MKAFYIYKETKIFKMYKLLLRRDRCSLFYWNRNAKKASTFVPYPNNGLYYSLCKESRDHFEEYFSRFTPPNTEKYTLDYIKRTFVYNFQDYYFFRKGIELEFGTLGSSKIIGPKLLSCIYENKPPRFNTFSIIVYLFQFFLCIPFILKYLLCCLAKRDKKKGPDVIYLRNKVFPDPLGIDYMGNVFNNSGISFDGVFYSFSWRIKKYGLYFINGYSNSTSALIGSLFKVLKYAVVDYSQFCHFYIPGKLFRRYLIDSLHVITILNLNPLVIFGVLEKNYSIFFKRYKKQWQTICTYSDGFLFSPSSGVDYVHADIFYSMNKLNSSNINVHGGEVEKTKEIGFIRSNIKADSKGISEDLKLILDRFDFKVIVALSQVETKIYFPIDLKAYERFMNKIYEIALNNIQCLFIIKEKKGELSKLPEDLIKKFEELHNSYVVETSGGNGAGMLSPYLSQNNHFEDLLPVTDLVISLAYNSTTIWQALSKGIPAISYFDGFDHSFLRDYPYFEVENKEVERAFNYWRNIEDASLNEFIQKLNSETQMFEKDALKNMIEDISLVVEERKIRSNRRSEGKITKKEYKLRP